jgi:hypothetical protein
MTPVTPEPSEPSEPFESFANERREKTIARVWSESMSTEELDHLAAHPSWRVRREIAVHPKTSDRTLGRLVFDSSARVRMSVVTLPKLPLVVLDALAVDPWLPIRMHVVGHVHARASTLLPMVNRTESGVAALARLEHHVDHRPGFDREVLAFDHEWSRLLAARSADRGVQEEIATSLPVDLEALRVLAANPHLHPELQEVMVQKPIVVLQVLCGRSDLVASVEATLSAGPEVVQAELASNPLLRHETQQRLSKSKHVAVRRALGLNPNLSFDAHARLIAGDHWSVHVNGLTSAHTTSNQVMDALASTSVSVRCVAARSSLVAGIDPVKLWALTKNYELVELIHLVANPVIPNEVLVRLVQRWAGGPPWRFPGTVARWPLGVALGNPSLDREILIAFSELDDLPAWVTRQLANNESLPAERREALLTWLALGGAVGEPTFDPLTCLGHPGDPNEHLAYVEFEKLIGSEGSPIHPLPKVRAGAVRETETIAFRLLERLASDPDSSVRFSAALHRPWSRKAMANYREDPEPAVLGAVQNAKVVKFWGRGARRFDRFAPVRSKHRSGVPSVIVLVVILLINALRACGSKLDLTERPSPAFASAERAYLRELHDQPPGLTSASTIAKTYGPQVVIAVAGGVPQFVVQEDGANTSFCAINTPGLPAASALTMEVECQPQGGPAFVDPVVLDFYWKYLQTPISLSRIPPKVEANDGSYVSSVERTGELLTMRIASARPEPGLTLKIAGVKPIRLETLGTLPRWLTLTVLHADGQRPDIELTGTWMSVKIPGTLARSE